MDDMKNIIGTVPDQLVRGTKAAENVSVPPFRRIICVGMGGSSIAGEILSMVHDDVVVHWDYGLPKAAAGGDLVIATSWSGNTEETISAWQAARDMGLDTLAICSGGRLSELAKESDTLLVELEHDNDSPRMNAAYMTAAIFTALGLREQLPAELAVDEMETQGRELASSIGDRMLAVYASHPMRKLTGFWKNIYSETVKRQVMAGWFPSAAHTEVVAWEGPYQDKIVPVLLRDTNEEAHYAKNFEALLALLPEKGYNVLTVQLSGSTVLEKVFNNYLLALWTSYHAAESLGVSPVSLALLNEFKTLKEKFE